MKKIFNLIFDFGVKNDLIKENKISYIDLGKKETVIERKIFTDEEIKRLFEEVSSKKNVSDVSDIVLILIFTGMRINELLNLKLKDVDLNRRIISITKSKTSSGIREIPIHDKIFDFIKERYNSSKEYLIENKNKKIPYLTFYFRFENLIKNQIFQPHTIHDTRHTFATLLNNSNANGTSIKKLIGHSDFLTTEKVYTHKDVEELRKAINSI